MAYTTLTAFLTDCADAIRAKTGSSATIVGEDIPSAIAAIPTGGASYVNYLLRGDAALVKTWSKDKKFVQDESGTIPAYTTSSTTLISSTALGTETIDLTSYVYFITMRFLTIPIYSDTTAVKGRMEYSMGIYPYEIMVIPAGEGVMISNSSKTITSSTNLNACGTLTRSAYWSSASATGWYTGTSYGVIQTAVAPTLSTSTLTINGPSLTIRGSSNYLSSSAWGKITDIRHQYIIKLYRVPISSTVRGWYISSGFQSMIADVKNNGGTLR